MNLFLKILATILIVIGGVLIGGWMLCMAGFGGGIFFLVLIIIPVVVAWFSLRSLWRKKERQKQKRDIYFLSNHNNTNIQLVSYIVNAKKDGLQESEIIENLIIEGGWDREEIKNIIEQI